MKYCFMQTHDCRLKLANAGSLFSMGKVAIYVAYLKSVASAINIKEEQPGSLMDLINRE